MGKRPDQFKLTFSDVLFCPQPVVEEERKQKIFTFKEAEIRE